MLEPTKDQLRNQIDRLQLALDETEEARQEAVAKLKAIEEILRPAKRNGERVRSGKFARQALARLEPLLSAVHPRTSRK
jgi:hypothetical protein